MTDGLLPNAVWVQNPRNGGGTYVSGHPWRIALHTIEGALGTLSASLPAGHPYPPHLWVDPSTRRLYQTVPLHRSAFALYQGNGPYTNRARALQVEIAGHAASAGDWPDQYLVNLAVDVMAPLCRWVEQQGGKINLDNVPPIGAIGGSASAQAPQRLSYSAWERFDGCCSHRHVPDNDHWDTGTLDIPRLVELTKQFLGEDLAPAATEQELEVYDFAERPGQPFPWTGFALPVLAMDSAVVRKGDTIIVNSTRPGRPRNVVLLSVSGASSAALLNWGAPVTFTAPEDGWTVVLTEADEGPGIIRVQGRKG